MSASREKKVRQDVKGQELTEKQLQAQKEAAQEKRNGILYTVIGVVAAVAVAALLVWNSGFFQGKAAAVNIGGTEYSAAEVQYYYNSCLNYYYTYAQYGLISNFDVKVDPAEQMYDEEAGITWHEQIMTEAIDTLAQSKAVIKLAKEEGFTLSEEGKHKVEHAMQDQEAAAISNGFTSTTAYLKAAFGSSMTKGKYEALQMENTLVSEYVAKYNEALNYTDEDLETYYTENADSMDVFHYSYAEVNGEPAQNKDADGNPVEPTQEQITAAMEGANQTAQDILRRLNAGVSFDTVLADYAQDEKVSVTADQKTVSAAADPDVYGWLAEEGRKVGDAGVLENSDGNGYFVVKVLGRGRNTERPADVRHILVAAQQDADAEQPTDAQFEAAKAEAEALLEQWKAGEATEDSFAALAKEKSADAGSAENGGLYEGVSSTTGFIKEFTDWALDPARQSGDTGLVKNTGSATKGWHIMYYVAGGEEVWKTEARTALSNEAINAWLDQLVEELGVERLDGLANVK